MLFRSLAGAWHCATILSRITNIQRQRLEKAFEAVKDKLVDKLNTLGEQAGEWRMDNQCNRLGVVKTEGSKQAKTGGGSQNGGPGGNDPRNGPPSKQGTNEGDAH